MTNGSDPINAITGEPVVNIEFEGLTKLEYFAARAMQGMVANPELNTMTKEVIAEYAYEQAVLLIKALNKESK